jgi:hypothetical protein
VLLCVYSGLVRSGALLIRLACVFASAGIAACDTGAAPKPVSTFTTEDPFARQLVGRVLAGTEPVAGALVRVDPSDGFAYDANLSATLSDAGVSLQRMTSTDSAGAYRLQYAPFLYDLSVRHDRETLVVRGLAGRAFDAPLGEDAAPTGYSAHIVPTTDPLPRPGNAVAFFVSGADARALAEGSGSRQVLFRRFDSTITLHAVEYDARKGLTSAVAEGRVDVRVTDGAVVTALVPTTLVPTTLKVKLVAEPPPEFTLPFLELEMDLGVRGSTVPVAHFAPGETIDISIVTDARYWLRGRATRGDTVSDSGRYLLNSFDPQPLVFPPPISTETPIDDDAVSTGMANNTLAPVTLAPGGTLAARLRKGVIEHVLTPESGDGPILRVVTSSRTTTLPDVTTLGLPRPTGRYRWTVQSFPTLPRVELLSGTDGRLTSPSWKSAPKLLSLP